MSAVMDRLKDMDIRPIAAAFGTTLRYRAGDVLFREGDEAEAMYVLVSGAVEVSSRGRVIEVIAPGDGLGIVSLLDGKPRTAQAVAVQESELVVLDARKFRYMVEQVPNFVWYVMDELTQRLRATNAAL
jgi:CRP/FNR family transcriptional regulator, cyclic AMP receptor protein